MVDGLVEIFLRDLDDGTGLVEIFLRSQWWTGLVEILSEISIVGQDWSKF